jgi:hypothetical protein
MRGPRDKFDPIGANRHGQRLFLADMFLMGGRTTSRETLSESAPVPAKPGEHEQLVLFTMRRDLAAHGRTGLHLRADPLRAAALEARGLRHRRRAGLDTKLLEGTPTGCASGWASRTATTLPSTPAT